MNRSGTIRCLPKPLRPRCAFTLLETLVVMSIIALLLAILLPALSAVRHTVKAFECSSNMRTVALEFDLFARGEQLDGRGRSEMLGGRRFWINDFQSSLYRLDEFWDLGEKTTGTLLAGQEVMLCPSGAQRLTKRKGFPCGSEAVGPTEDISLAMNMRLYRASISFREKRVLAPAASTHVPERILHHPYVPLALDVDGREAAHRGLEPFYIAPPLPGDDEDPYAGNRYWMPAHRHSGKVNVAFVGGHVLSSHDPATERWDWAWQAEAGR